jgi:hypothetical protein
LFVLASAVAVAVHHRGGAVSAAGGSDDGAAAVRIIAGLPSVSVTFVVHCLLLLQWLFIIEGVP